MFLDGPRGLDLEHHRAAPFDRPLEEGEMFAAQPFQTGQDARARTGICGWNVSMNASNRLLSRGRDELRHFERDHTATGIAAEQLGSVRAAVVALPPRRRPPWLRWSGAAVSRRRCPRPEARRTRLPGSIARARSRKFRTLPPAPWTQKNGSRIVPVFHLDQELEGRHRASSSPRRASSVARSSAAHFATVGA